jgi:putative ABC transport system substrate-binding protein
VTTQAFGALNRLTTITEPSTGVTARQYDPGDKLTNVTDPNTHQTRYVNDGFGDRIQEVSPDRGTTVYHYDLGGNLTQRIDGAGTVTNNTYDALDRILATSYPGGSAENVAYTYDSGTNDIGRLTSLTDAAGGLTLAYDRRGNITQTARTHGSAVLTTGYTYDPASRVASIAYPSGLTVAYTRDAMGRVVSVGAANSSIGLASTQVAYGLVYQPFGPPSSLAYGNGQNLAIEYRWAEGRDDRLPALAIDLVGRKVDVIATSGGPAPTLAAKGATSTIPIVFVSGDPIGDGLVASLARPGGNLTGVSILVVELNPKRLELLSELVPRAEMIALLVNPNNPQTERVTHDVAEAARTKGVQLAVVKARTESEIDAAFARLLQLQAGALLVQADPVFTGLREAIVMLAARHAVPAIYPLREFAASGGLISYGASLTGSYRLAGGYVGKLLKGAKPADLPVQQPTTFELVVNLKTAQALGLTVPPSILARADEVIE